MRTNHLKKKKTEVCTLQKFIWWIPSSLLRWHSALQQLNILIFCFIIGQQCPSMRLTQRHGGMDCSSLVKHNMYMHNIGRKDAFVLKSQKVDQLPAHWLQVLLQTHTVRVHCLHFNKLSCDNRHIWSQSSQRLHSQSSWFVVPHSLHFGSSQFPLSPCTGTMIDPHRMRLSRVWSSTLLYYISRSFGYRNIDDRYHQYQRDHLVGQSTITRRCYRI